ncbi:MAG: ribosomal protein S18-alanine N-acetyltransferase [Hyphomonadaceae bacterium]
MSAELAPVDLAPVRALSADSLAALHAEAFAQPWAAADFSHMLAQANVFGFAARADGAAPFCGFILAWAQAGEAEILTLAVRPAARRAGLGLALVQAALAQGLALGAAQMFLEVGAENEAARALYARAGFAEVSRRKGYYQSADGARDALVLRCDLKSASQADQPA